MVVLTKNGTPLPHYLLLLVVAVVAIMFDLRERNHRRCSTAIQSAAIVGVAGVVVVAGCRWWWRCGFFSFLLFGEGKGEEGDGLECMGVGHVGCGSRLHTRR